MTLPALIQANAIYMNGVLRKQYGMKPKRPLGMTAGSLSKAAMARAVKLVSRKGPPKSPTPVTFEIDLSQDTCVRHVA